MRCYEFTRIRMKLQKLIQNFLYHLHRYPMYSNYFGLLGILLF